MSRFQRCLIDRRFVKKTQDSLITCDLTVVCCVVVSQDVDANIQSLLSLQHCAVFRILGNLERYVNGGESRVLLCSIRHVLKV